MRINYLKLLSTLVIFTCICLSTTNAVFAVNKSAKGGKIDLAAISTTIDDLTKKIYSSALFSPNDNEDLIDIKIKLDNAMLSAPSPEYAPLYYKAGTLYNRREYRELAVDCFQAILENFPDTALGPKARKELAKMGIIVQVEEEDSEE